MYNIKFVRISNNLINIGEIVKVKKETYNGDHYIYVTMKDVVHNHRYDYPNISELELAFRYLEAELVK